MRRQRAIWLGVGVALMGFLLTDAFVAPPAHDVHSPGGVPAKVAFYESNENVAWFQSPPSQSLADMKCRIPSQGKECDSSTLATYFPNLMQTPQTLYLTWSHCISWLGYGEITPWEGSNIEYVPSSRELVIHCYRAKPWLYAHQYLYGVAGTGRWALAAVSTAWMGPGTITIMEDDHLEHLVGDQSDVYQLATARIS